MRNQKPASSISLDGTRDGLCTNEVHKKLMSNIITAQATSYKYYASSTPPKPLPTACPHCGSASLAISPATPPHAARLDCEDCGGWIKWIGKSQAAAAGIVEGVSNA